MEIESEGWQATRKARFYVVGLTGLPCQSISSLVLALFFCLHLPVFSLDLFDHLCLFSPLLTFHLLSLYLQAKMSCVSFHLVLRLGYKHL
jgi:hypothetical protein